MEKVTDRHVWSIPTSDWLAYQRFGRTIKCNKMEDYKKKGEHISCRIIIAINCIMGYNGLSQGEGWQVMLFLFMKQVQDIIEEVQYFFRKEKRS